MRSLHSFPFFGRCSLSYAEQKLQATTVCRLNFRARAKWVVSALALILLTGCDTILKKPPPAQLYLLEPVVGEAAVSAISEGSMVVRKPLANPGLESAQIALTQPGFKLSYFAETQWAESVPTLVQYFLVESLQNQRLFGLVAPESRLAGNQFWLDAHVHDFQAEYTDASTAPIVHIKILFTLVDGAGQASQFEEAVRVRTTSNEVESIIDGFQLGMEAVSKALVRRLQASIEGRYPAIKAD